MLDLSILLYWPLAWVIVGTFLPKRFLPVFTLIGTLVPVGLAVALIFNFDNGAAGAVLQHVTDDSWIPSLGIHYKLGIDGLNLWLVGLTTLLFAASAIWLIFRPVERPKLFALHLGIAETAVLGAFTAQDLALFVLFFD